jgi:lipoate---protein ligase
MIYIDNPSLDPWFNLALEEYYLRNSEITDDIVILWQNDKSVIIGRHQNTVKEINYRFIDENGIKVARRMTGGGAVYHDLGNLNFTYITTFDSSGNVDFRKFACPVIEALKGYGLAPELSGRNDILLDGKKISGTAQACIGKRLMFHGTLLYDINVENAGRSLNVKADKIEAKGVESVKSRITNIKPYLPKDCSIRDLKESILTSFAKSKNFSTKEINPEDVRFITELKNSKYSTAEWIFGETSKGNFYNSRRFQGGAIEISLDIHEGKIKSCSINGDFLGVCDIGDFEKSLIGTDYQISNIKKILNAADIQRYFGSITANELLECMFPGGDQEFITES